MKAVYNNRGVRVPGMIMKKGGSFPDLSGDGKITKKDILMGRGVIKKKKGGSAPKGYHYMPDGRLMKDSDHKKKGGSTKDACYHKVVRRYGPKTSAYRSGAMAKCRKMGAANWGNSKKK